MIDLECGQKRLRLARFDDDPGELVGAICCALLSGKGAREISPIKLNASLEWTDADHVGNVAHAIFPGNTTRLTPSRPGASGVTAHRIARQYRYGSISSSG